jgi:DedD protein
LDYNVFLQARISLEERLKERLTGAAILVLLVAWLLPEIFRGRQPAVVTAGSTATTDAAAGPSVTFGVVPETALEPEVQPVPVPAPATSPSLPLPPATAAMAAPAALATPAAAPVVPPPVASVPKPAPAVSAAPTAAAKEAKAAVSGWVVQVGSFTERANAQRMVQQGARKDFKLQVAGPDDRGYFRVRSAVLRDRAAAVAYQARLKSKGLKGVIGTAP